MAPVLRRAAAVVVVPLVPGLARLAAAQGAVVGAAALGMSAIAVEKRPGSHTRAPRRAAGRGVPPMRPQTSHYPHVSCVLVFLAASASEVT